MAALESDTEQNTEEDAKNIEDLIKSDDDGEAADNDEETEVEADEPKTVINEITNNTVSIEGTSNSVAYATACGLRSAVSIYCSFETTYSGNPWNPTPSTQSYYTTGSGVVYSLENDGSAFIVTNYHVVYDSMSNTENCISDTIYVYLYGMEADEYAIPATYVGGSPNYDLAVLRVDKSEILSSAMATGSAAAVTLGDSDKLMPGDATIAIGNPAATDLSGISVTKGIVSVDSEYITMSVSEETGEVDFRVIRTDTPVNSGNSGGGLFNDSGELIGIVNAKISSSSVENIGYAIPSGVVRAVADNIIDYCYENDCESVMRAMLGLQITVSAMSTAYDVETGALEKYEEISVYELSEGGIAESVLKIGDVLKSITVGEKTVEITRRHHLIDAMLDARVGEAISLVIERDGTQITVSLEISEGCLAEY